MDWNWLTSILYGLLSGFSELLPVSSAAHRQLLCTLSGIQGGELPFRLMTHLGVLLALIVLCQPQIAKLRREKRIASTPTRRRKRSPDSGSLAEYRLLKTAMLPLLVMAILYVAFCRWESKPWVLSIVLIFHGAILYIPQFLPQANKNIYSLSALDGMLTGVMGGLGWIPGVSFIGPMTSAMQMRGADKEYLTQFCMLLLLPLTVLLIIADIYFMAVASVGFSAAYLLLYLLAGIFSCVGAYLGGVFLRFLSVRLGFSGFAYYNWGLALLLFILYLTI